MYKLKSLEKRILTEIYLFGIPEKTIVKKRLRIKNDTLNYVLKKLEQKKIIKNYIYRVDLGKLGLKQIAWIFLKFDRRFTKEVDSIIKNLFSKHQTQFVSFIVGNFDLALKVFEKDFVSLDKFESKIEKELGESLLEIKTFFVSQSIKEYGFETIKSNSQKLSKKELDVLNEKMLFPNKKSSEIAKLLGFHRNTVSNIWNALKDKKIIVKKIPILSQEALGKIGYSFSALILVRTLTGKQEEVTKQLVKSNHVFELFRLSSSSDIFIHGRFSGIMDFNDFVKLFYKNTSLSKNIINSETFITLQRYDYKRDFLKEFNLFK